MSGLLVRTAREFAQGELAPALRAAEAARGVHPHVHDSYAAIGLLGLELPVASWGPDSARSRACW